MRLTYLIALTGFLFFASCDEVPKPESPEVRRAKAEAGVAVDDDAAKRAEVLSAGHEFIARAFPDWKLHGASSYHHSENVYTVAEDISKGEERRTVYVAVRLFVDDNGQSYWKAEHTPDEDEQRIPGFAIRPYQK